MNSRYLTQLFNQLMNHVEPVNPKEKDVELGPLNNDDLRLLASKDYEEANTAYQKADYKHAIQCCQSAKQAIEKIPPNERQTNDWRKLFTYHMVTGNSTSKVKDLWSGLANWAAVIEPYETSLSIVEHISKKELNAQDYLLMSLVHRNLSGAYRNQSLFNYLTSYHHVLSAIDCLALGSSLRLKNGEKIDLEELTANYKRAADFCTYGDYDYKLYSFGSQLFSGSSLTYENFNHVLSSLGSQKTSTILNSTLQLMVLIRDTLHASNFPNTPLKEYLQDPQHLNEFQQKIDEIKKEILSLPHFADNTVNNILTLPDDLENRTQKENITLKSSNAFKGNEPDRLFSHNNSNNNNNLNEDKPQHRRRSYSFS